ncbi:MAG: hypothetical protein D6753_10925 [Planctomycetota bacterium]|nr:MAG: hypothetical protein D6753_10925 [Planctomycetota bacterium]
MVMAFTHEIGHIVGGWCCGGTLKTADLIPWHLPYSIFDPDPKPLVTLWCGPILGIVVPPTARTSADPRRKRRPHREMRPALRCATSPSVQVVLGHGGKIPRAGQCRAR